MHQKNQKQGSKEGKEPIESSQITAISSEDSESVDPKQQDVSLQWLTALNNKEVQDALIACISQGVSAKIVNVVNATDKLNKRMDELEKSLQSNMEMCADQHQEDKTEREKLISSSL